MNYTLLLIIALLTWSLAWKGLALWTAGKRGEKKWFILFFLFNTLGIVEIFYLYTRKKVKTNENMQNVRKFKRIRDY